jgi:hypothetical protein
LGSKTTPVILVTVSLLCAIIPAAAAVPSAIAQEENDENLAGSIVSEVLKGGDAEDDETDQDSPNTATPNPNQDQTVVQDDTVIVGDDNADLDAANVAIPIAIPISIEEVPPECPEGFAP